MERWKGVASDSIPELTKERTLRRTVLHFAAFVLGLVLLLLPRLLAGAHG